MRLKPHVGSSPTFGTMKNLASILRNALIKRVENSTAPEFRRNNYTSEELADGIANGMPIILSRFTNLNSNEEDIRVWSQKTLQEYATEYGFKDIEDLRTALTDLTEELKQELPEKVWKTYFGESSKR